MSPKKPVENLSVLCVKSVTALSLDAIKARGEESLAELKKYFRRVPQNMKEAVLNGVFDATPLSSYSKWVCFCVFGLRCSKFDSRNLSPKFHMRFAESLEGVLHLNLTDAQVKEQVLRKLIKRCPKLRSLVIPNMSTDRILKEVKNLQNLEYLDISSNAILSTTGLSYLCNPSLLVLNIGAPLTYSIANYEGYDTLVDILLQLPNLREIRTYEYTGRALLELKKPYVSKLISICDCDTNIEQMEAITAVCPYLEELTLEDPEKEALKLLDELGHLKTLKINRFSEKPLILNLKHLTLKTLEAKQISIDLNNLCITIENILARSCKIFSSLKEEICFRNLRVLEFIDCDIKKPTVIALLLYCDMLKRLAISHDIGLTDLDIRTLCRNNNLKNLQELWLSMAKKLTSDSVILLMNHCDKLKVLGTLNGWNIERVEINYLRCVIYFTNSDLNLLHFSCF